MVINVLESSDIALKTLCNEMDQYCFPKFALKTVFTAGGIYLMCVCVCTYMGVTWRSRGGGASGPPIFLLPKNFFFGY